jgi:predicted ferric reductase
MLPVMQIPVLPRRLRANMAALPMPLPAFATVGDLLLTLPLIIFFVKGYHSTFVVPSLDLSGKEATNAIYWAFLTATKSNSIFSLFLGIPFERMIPLHQFSALLAVVLGCFHVYVAYQYGGDDDGDSKHADFGEDPNPVLFLGDGSTNLSGTILLGALGALVSMSVFANFRRIFFRLWYASHMVLGLLVLVGLFWHSVSSAVFVTAWWALDLAVRYGVMASWQYRTSATLRLIGQEEGEEGRARNEPAVEIRFAKPTGFDYNAGQFVQISIPKLGVYEFHPLTLSSAPHESHVTLHVRALGDWSDRLVKLAQESTSTDVLLEGPYGACAVDLSGDGERYPVVLLVSGGIGVTPCQSIGKSLLHQHHTLGRPLQHMRFVWTVRNMRMVHDMPPLGGGADFSSSTTNKAIRPQPSSGFATMVSMDEEDQSSAFEMTTSPTAVDDGPTAVPLVQVDIHCTRAATATAPPAAANCQYNLHNGRPDLDALFEDMKEVARTLGIENVAVIGCGPIPLMRQLRACCLRHSTSIVGGCGTDPGIFFDLHTEMFEF